MGVVGEVADGVRLFKTLREVEGEDRNLAEDPERIQMLRVAEKERDAQRAKELAEQPVSWGKLLLAGLLGVVGGVALTTRGKQ